MQLEKMQAVRITGLQQQQQQKEQKERQESREQLHQSAEGRSKLFDANVKKCHQIFNSWFGRGIQNVRSVS